MPKVKETLDLNWETFDGGKWASEDDDIARAYAGKFFVAVPGKILVYGDDWLAVQEQAGRMLGDNPDRISVQSIVHPNEWFRDYPHASDKHNASFASIDYLNSQFETAGTGKSGPWKIEVSVSDLTPKRWELEVESCGGFFSDLTISIGDSATVDPMLRFIEETLGAVQHSEKNPSAFTCPRLTLGDFAGVPVDFYKDGADDRYFLVVAERGRGSFRFVIAEDNLNHFIAALRDLNAELANYRTDHGWALPPPN